MLAFLAKRAAIDAVRQAVSKRQYRTNKDLIPVAVWKELATAKGKESWVSIAKKAGIKGYSNIHVGKRALSRERLFKLACALEQCSPAKSC